MPVPALLVVHGSHRLTGRSQCRLKVTRHLYVRDRDPVGGAVRPARSILTMSVRDNPPRPDRRQEPVAPGDPLPRARLEVEEVTQEVLGRGVLAGTPIGWGTP
jgi:hypothetical protein